MSKHQAEIVLSHIRRLAAAESGPPDDRHLLERFAQQREEASFAALLDRYGPMVLRVCRRVLHDAHEAEDAFQATFLILARKAGTIRRHQSLASWLYRVAYHVAVRARAGAVRREELTARVPRRPAVDPLAEVSGRELLGVIDEELQRMPEKYRAPLLLCYLEGHTQDEAARQLGWSPHVLRGRVERGRTVLRRRLIRRGLGLSAVLASGLLERVRGADEVSAVLIERTLRVAKASIDRGVVSPHVAALAESGINPLGATKLKLVASMVLTLSVLTVGLGAGLPMLRTPEPEAPSTAPAATPSEQVKKEPRRDRSGDLLPPGAVARLGTVRLRQSGIVHGLAFAPDGKTLAAGGNYWGVDDRAIYLWDIASGQLLRSFFGHGHAVLSLAFCPDGKTIASVGRDQTIRLWDVATSKEVRRLDTPDDVLAFSPDGRRLATISSREQKLPITIWNPATAQKLLRLPAQEPHVSSLTFSPDGKILAAAGQGAKLVLWDVASGKEVRRINIGAFDIHRRQVAFTPDGKRLATSSADHTIRLWDVSSGEEIRAFRGHKRRVRCLAFAADGKTLISAAEDRIVRFWDVATGKERRAVPFDVGAFLLNDVAFSPHEKMLAVGANNAIRLWDLDDGKELRPTGHMAPVSTLAFSTDGQTVTSISWDRTYRCWDTTTGRELQRGEGLKCTLLSVPLLPTVKEANAISFMVYATCLSPDGRLLATGEGDKEARIHLWDTAAGKEIRSFASNSGSVLVLAFAPDGRIVASGSWDKSVRLWDVATGKELHRLIGHGGEVHSVCFSPDGKWLASASADRTVRVWEVATGRELHRLRHEVSVFSLAFSPDGRTLAASGGQYANDPPGDKRIVLWEMATGKERRRLAGDGWVTGALAFSPDGRFLASTGANGVIQVWEPLAGGERGRFASHQGLVKSLAFSRDGRRLASGGSDTTVLVWDLDPIAKRRQSTPELTNRERVQAIDDLLGPDAGKAYQAVATLAATPRRTLPWLRTQLKPAAGVEERKVRRLVEQLDDDAFAVREKAMRELERWRESAEPFLRKALEKSPSLERRRRIEQLLEPLSNPLSSAERVRQLRLLEVLEQIGTKEAEELLKTLAGGAPGVFLTREAKASRDRLARNAEP